MDVARRFYDVEILEAPTSLGNFDPNVVYWYIVTTTTIHPLIQDTKKMKNEKTGKMKMLEAVYSYNEDTGTWIADEYPDRTYEFTEVDYHMARSRGLRWAYYPTSVFRQMAIATVIFDAEIIEYPELSFDPDVIY